MTKFLYDSINSKKKKKIEIFIICPIVTEYIMKKCLRIHKFIEELKTNNVSYLIIRIARIMKNLKA